MLGVMKSEYVVNGLHYPALSPREQSHCRRNTGRGARTREGYGIPSMTGGVRVKQAHPHALGLVYLEDRRGKKKEEATKPCPLRRHELMLLSLSPSYFPGSSEPSLI